VHEAANAHTGVDKRSLNVKTNVMRSVLIVPAMFAAAFIMQSSAKSDTTVPLAPPIAVPTSSATTADTDPFDWHEVPANEKVTIVRATFDQGGYQLFDDVNEVILVPFVNNNLYVMKFGRSTSNHIMFENVDGVPVLYVPNNCYLENATTPTARWYPFSDDFAPIRPLYLGIAPSWDDYVVMGWYPGMYVYAGYWCHRPWSEAVVVCPATNFLVVIGTSRFLGWTSFHHYWSVRPAPFHMGIGHADYYRRIGHPELLGSPARGLDAGRHDLRGDAIVGHDRGFGGGGGRGGDRGVFGGGGRGGDRGGYGGGGGDHSFHGNH